MRFEEQLALDYNKSQWIIPGYFCHWRYFFQLLAGILGQIIPYKIAALILGMVTLVSMILLIVIPKHQNRPIYEAVRTESLNSKKEVDSIEDCVYDN